MKSQEQPTFNAKTEANIKIAKFCGGKLEYLNCKDDIHRWFVTFHGRKIYRDGVSATISHNVIPVHLLMYDLKWDWLMIAGEKCNKRYDLYANTLKAGSKEEILLFNAINNVRKYIGKTNKQMAWASVADFIDAFHKVYNYSEKTLSKNPNDE